MVVAGCVDAALRVPALHVHHRNKQPERRTWPDAKGRDFYGQYSNPITALTVSDFNENLRTHC